MNVFLFIRNVFFSFSEGKWARNFAYFRLMFRFLNSLYLKKRRRFLTFYKKKSLKQLKKRKELKRVLFSKFMKRSFKLSVLCSFLSWRFKERHISLYPGIFLSVFERLVKLFRISVLYKPFNSKILGALERFRSRQSTKNYVVLLRRHLKVLKKVYFSLLKTKKKN